MVDIEQLKNIQCPEGKIENIDNNLHVSRHRMDSGKPYVDWEIYNMTHVGNDPRTNKNMLERAAYMYSKNVFTDDEWNEYFIPAINEMIRQNNTFERWYPGYLIENKKSHERCIVKHDYALGCGHMCIHGCRDYTSLYVYALDENENITHSFGWTRYDDYILLDKEHIVENLDKITAYEESLIHNYD